MDTTLPSHDDDSEVQELTNIRNKLYRRKQKSERLCMEEVRQLDRVFEFSHLFGKSPNLVRRHRKLKAKIAERKEFELQLCREITQIEEKIHSIRILLSQNNSEAKKRANTRVAILKKNNSQKQSAIKEEIPFDLFISHASEDKDKFVRPLVEALSALDLRIWYDEHSLSLGDSLRRSIDDGLAKSRFGCVVLSKSFFNKEWTQYELNGLHAREIQKGKVILPIWHGIDKEYLLKNSPSLADKVAISTASNDCDTVALKLYEVARNDL